MVKRQLTYESALARAASLCSRGEHAEAEMRRKLRQWGAETGDADRVVEWLVDNGFVDNSRYAHAFVYDKSRFDLWGRVKIRHQVWLVMWLRRRWLKSMRMSMWRIYARCLRRKVAL